MATAKEAVYDEQIFPLMAQIIDICKRHRIAFVFDAALGRDREHDDDQLKCTSFLVDDDCEPPDELLKIVEMVRPRRPVVAAFTIMKGGHSSDAATNK